MWLFTRSSDLFEVPLKQRLVPLRPHRRWQRRRIPAVCPKLDLLRPLRLPTSHLRISSRIINCRVIGEPSLLYRRLSSATSSHLSSHLLGGGAHSAHSKKRLHGSKAANSKTDDLDHHHHHHQLLLTSNPSILDMQHAVLFLWTPIPDIPDVEISEE